MIIMCPILHIPGRFSVCSMKFRWTFSANKLYSLLVAYLAGFTVIFKVQGSTHCGTGALVV